MTGNPDPSKDNGQLVLAIKEEHISVTPDSEVKVHIAVINQTSGEDYVDILVKGVPSDWVTIDTPVVHLDAGEAKQVILTVQPPVVPQSRVGQYPLDIQAVSQVDPKRSATVQSSLVVAAYHSKGRIGVMLGSLQFSVAPGSSITIPILLQNRGTEADNFGLNVEGIPANWVSTNSTVTRLDPSTSKEIQLTIRVPRSPAADAGRMPFKIQFTSQVLPDQKAEVDCILTVSAFSVFSASLQPEKLQAGQIGQLIITNTGNITSTYTLEFHSAANELVFEKGVQVPRPGAQPGTPQVEISYVEIPKGEKFLIASGERGIYPFRSRLRSRPIVGNEKAYPFTVQAQSSDNKLVKLPGEVVEKGFVPMWLVSASLIGIAILCLVMSLYPLSGIRRAASATQTAAYIQTRAAFSPEDDSDGDGLSNGEEIENGTDPFKPDTDEDALLDGEEVNTFKTDPLSPDTDEDGLSDGEEVKTYMTDPLNPDSDADLLGDGDEIARKTDPLKPDTDQDGLGDGDEVRLGTDPLQQDTDKDQLLDSQENQTCPRPLDPDSDSDGIIDGNDLDPCDPMNPALTATAFAANPTPAPVTPTPAPPTDAPTNPPVPTNTNPPAATPTLVFPPLDGIVLFESNRDGNSEIYALNLTTRSMLRLTDDPAADMQPALAPDSLLVAYASNKNGNNEIYLTGMDRRSPLNLTNSSSDDQQPTWSPDGDWIAFTSNRDGNQEIYIMRSDGSEVRNLTNNSSDDFAPSWFSVPRLLGSEEWIAFTSNRDGNLEIYKIRPDGSGLENLTENSANDFFPSGVFGGGLLAFVTDRDGNPEIYTMTDSGGAPTNVTNHFAQDLDPSLSPDLEWIIFATDRDGNLEIYAINIGDGSTYNLTGIPGQDRNPDW